MKFDGISPIKNGFMVSRADTREKTTRKIRHNRVLGGLCVGREGWMSGLVVECHEGANKGSKSRYVYEVYKGEKLL
tara:strand:- start:97 stop:324 length:228 start_codon:yes stop_codon:yes gene_type:complete